MRGFNTQRCQRSSSRRTHDDGAHGGRRTRAARADGSRANG
jgi:hypothetical protein